MSLTKETIFQYAWNLKNEIKSLSFIIFQLIVSISCKKKNQGNVPQERVRGLES